MNIILIFTCALLAGIVLGEECPEANTEFIARTVGQGPITTWDCYGSNIAEIPNVLDWDDCGYICKAKEECKWWTYNVADETCALKTSCRWGAYNNNTISGNKGCPNYFDEQADYVCKPCGNCSCCYGGCTWGTCSECAPNAIKDLSQDEACLWEANAIGKKECEEDCKTDGDVCDGCISNIIPEFCKTPKKKTKCSSLLLCAFPVAKAINTCRKNPGLKDPTKFVKCVLAAVSTKCKKKACTCICNQISKGDCKICDNIEHIG